MKRKKHRDTEERILLYRLGEDTGKGAALRALLTQMSIPFVTVNAEDLSQTVGFLAGLDSLSLPAAPYQGEIPCEECMVMRGLSSAKLDRLLRNMRQMGIPPVTLKAMVTPINKDWTMLQLMTEIKKEHEQMHAANSPLQK